MKKKIVFLTGAGMSAESGFRTFRGNGGLWEDYPVEQVATHEGWEKDPVLVTAFYNRLRRKLWDSRPNEGHRLIAAMEEHCRITVLTQNVDDLHERAGSTNVIHLHGELSKVCSSDRPYDSRYIRQLDPAHSDVTPGTLAGDGSLLRPFIVFFGEDVPLFEAAAREAQQADAFVIIGTSLNVYPAAGLASHTGRGCPIYLIDPNPVGTGHLPHLTHIKSGASEGMKRLLAMPGFQTAPPHHIKR